MNRLAWLIRVSYVVMAVAGAPHSAGAQEPETDRGLPPRFHVAESVRPVFLELLQRAPTFRAQCQRVVDAEVRVVIEVGMPWDFDKGIRAVSQVIRNESGQVRFVRMRLRHDGPRILLLAHEFEHVIEQLEGVDLERATAKHDGSAWRAGTRAYETRRACEMGHRVEREYKDGGAVAMLGTFRDDAGLRDSRLSSR